MKGEALLSLAALLALGAPAAAEGFAGLGREAGGFAQPAPGGRLEFPRDHGPHPDYRVEWWYVTANLKDDAGAAYGVQWTLFRLALSPGEPRPGWSDRNIWMGHAAATRAGAHRFAQSLARGGIGQAGVEAAPFKAWIDDWRFEAAEDGAGLTQLRLSARGPGFRYALDLAAEGPLVLHGEAGFSRKSTRGQASYYYSQPFFSARGALVLDGRELKVTGRAWMDREWSSQALAPDQKGWDWFALHLANGEKAMLYRFRSLTDPPYFAGTWIGADGAAQPLAGEDIALAPLEESAVAGRKIPTRWRVAVKSRGLAVETAPLNPKSWMGTNFPYWEGPIAFQGSHSGEGYLEMTGY